MSTTASALYAAEGAPSSDADACAPLPPPPPPPPRLTLAEANALPAADFRSAFANVVECCPEVAAALAQQRPFHSVAAVAAAAGALLDALPMAARRRVLLLHPDLAGRLAARGLLTAESQREQHAAGLLRLPPAQAQRLRALNASYRARFGFPFVACARGRSADSLLDDLAARLQREPHQELDAAMHEVKLICAMRLQELLSDE